MLSLCQLECHRLSTVDATATISTTFCLVAIVQEGKDRSDHAIIFVATALNSILYCLQKFLSLIKRHFYILTWSARYGAILIPRVDRPVSNRTSLAFFMSSLPEYHKGMKTIFYYVQIMMASLISVLSMATAICHQVGAMSDTAPRRMLLQGEARGVLSNVNECTNTYLALKAFSDANSERLTVLEEGSIWNINQLDNLTERIAITTADLVRTSVNISETQMTYSTLLQDLVLFTSDLVGITNDVVQSQAQLDALTNIQTVNETTYDLRVYSTAPGNIITSSDIFVSEAVCPSGLRPIKVDCGIQGVVASSFIDATTTGSLSGFLSTALFRQEMIGSSGICAYQVFYIDSLGIQQDIAYASTQVPPISVTTTVQCRAA